MSRRLPRMKPIVPWWQLGTLLVLCATGVYVLLPDDPKLIENLIRDRDYRGARQLLQRLPAAERARDSDRFRRLEVRLGRHELPPADGDPILRAAAVDTFWRAAVAAWRDSRFDEAVFAEFAPLIPELTDPARAWSELAPDFERIPAASRAALVDALTRAALARSQPAAAAEISARGHPASARTAPQALELARLWQLAGRPADALAALDGHDTPEVDARRVPLLRELNRNREALALLRRRAEASATPPDAAAAAELANVALAAGAAAEAVPGYRRFAEANPANLAAARQLRALLVAAGVPAEAVAIARRVAERGGRQSDDVVELARILEWSSLPNDAFDVWLELARQNHPGALERLIELNRGLFRDADLAGVLEQAVAAAPTDERVLTLARLLVDLGRYGQATPLFERYLAQRAAPDVVLELVRVQRDNFDFPAAERWLRRFLASHPDDIARQRELAELLMYQRRHAEALVIYGDLIATSDDEAVIGPFTRIAESLGRYDEFARGLQRRVDAAKTPSERDYVLLAYAHELAANSAARRTALEAGLRRHPRSDDLRLQLAYVLAAEKQYRAARETLAAHSRLRTDLGALTLYLELLRLGQDTAAEREFLREPLAPDLAAEEAVMERVARAREALGHDAEAGRLWGELHARNPDDYSRAAEFARLLLAQEKPADALRVLAPFLSEPTPPALRLAAEISAALGDHRAAERYQIAYLHAEPSAPAAEWGALGDLRHAYGDRAGARHAYTEALRRLHAAMAAPRSPR